MFAYTGLYYDFQEIIPFEQGDFRWDRADNAVSKFNNETEVRALLEGQFVAKRAHAEEFGFTIGLYTLICHVTIATFVCFKITQNKGKLCSC